MLANKIDLMSRYVNSLLTSGNFFSFKYVLSSHSLFCDFFYSYTVLSLKLNIIFVFIFQACMINRYSMEIPIAPGLTIKFIWRKALFPKLLANRFALPNICFTFFYSISLNNVLMEAHRKNVEREVWKIRPPEL